MFAFVSAFPKSLHCTEEAQQAETVLSAVLSIYIYILKEEGSQNKLKTKKSQKGKSTRQGSNLWHRFFWQMEITHTIHHAIAPFSKKDG